MSRRAKKVAIRDEIGEHFGEIEYIVVNFYNVASFRRQFEFARNVSLSYLLVGFLLI